MRVVLYTNQCEPITVIEVPLESCRFRHPMYRVPFILDDSVSNRPQYHNTMLIRVEELVMHGKSHPMFFVNEFDLVNAMELPTIPLARQREDFERRFKDGFEEGFIKGLVSVL